MKIRRPGKTLAGALTIAFALAAPAAPTQGAQKAKPKCPDRALCVWDEENYTGERVVVRGRKLSNKIYNQMNDLASSAFLNRKKGVGVLWTDAGGQGEAVCLYEENRRRINKLGAPFDDSISSSDVRKGIHPSCIL